jgi:hypothetical protein
MNTKRIQNTKTLKLWSFPQIAQGKQGRVFTKHYTNMAFVLNPNHFSLLSFLVYHSGYDNVLEYKERILKAYIKTLKDGAEYYGTENNLLTSLPRVRDSFEWLIQNGFLLNIGGKQFLINPNLTYSKLYVKADFYKEWTWIYNENYEIKHLVHRYLEHVHNNYSRRHK